MSDSKIVRVKLLKRELINRFGDRFISISEDESK